MGVANSGSVGRGKRFGVADRPARTDDNAANVQRDLRFGSNRPAQAAADARLKSETGGQRISRSTTVSAYIRPASLA
jgi:hypothetical protein